MKKSELRELIREEIQKLNEARNVFHTKDFKFTEIKGSIDDVMDNPKKYFTGDIKGKEFQRFLNKVNQWKNAGFKIIKILPGSDGGDISASLF